MAVISLFTALMLGILGFAFPTFMGWLVIVVMPIGSGFTGLTFVPSSSVPLRLVQVAFFVTLGILIRKKKSLQLIISLLGHSHVFRALLFFIGLLFFFSLQNSESIFWRRYVLYYFPSIILALLVGCLMIRNRHDFDRLMRIFTWSSAIIGALCIVEFSTGVNLSTLSELATNPNVSYGELQLGSYRSGYYRVVGTDGDPVSTAIKLGFLFPFTIWYLSRKRLIGWLPCALTIIGIFLCQSRAVFVSIPLGMLVSMATSIAATKRMLLVIFVGILLFINVPGMNDFVSSSISSISEVFVSTVKGEYVDERSISIPSAINYFLASPLYGYGSPNYVMDALMHGGDLPAFLLYLVSGGFLLFLAYVSFLLGMFISVLRRTLIEKKREQRIILSLLLFAFANGILPLFFNTMEKHFLVMMMAYAAFFKVFIYNRIMPINKGKKACPMTKGNVPPVVRT